ncbi:MAG TPA: hypothetical protein VFT41_01205 [Gemmatimonadaceae bacterium]|nr:hypothetical protein [Gemmatimonadaceae bacterium]
MSLVAAPLAAQAAPGTDVFLVRVRGGAAATIADPPVNLTRRPGYDNQPAFAPDGRSLLFTSIRGDGQADIYRVDLASRAVTQVTRTAESEYSPTPLPTGSGFSVVRVERDSAQRLWAFNDAGGAPVLLLPDIAPVGYHAWLDDSTLALFVLGAPSTLQFANLRTGEHRVIARDIGRSLQRVPGSRRCSFLEHEGGGWALETADPAAPDGAVRRLAAMPPGAEYVVWASPTVALTASGTLVYRLDVGAGAAWTPVADFAQEGLRELSRLAISPDGRWLAVVADDQRP